EELFPTIPHEPLTQLYPELDDNDSPLPKGEGQGEGEGTAHQPSAQNPATSDPTDQSAPSDSPDRSNPACCAEASECRRVKPGQTESNQIQPGSPLDPEPNPNTDNAL